MTHYDREDIVELYADSKGVTVESLEGQHISTELTLEEGETAYAPWTTKYDVGGPGKMGYLFYPNGSGDHGRIIEGTHRSYPPSYPPAGD